VIEPQLLELLERNVHANRELFLRRMPVVAELDWSNDLHRKHILNLSPKSTGYSLIVGSDM
jgi:hypothetical protein